MLNKGENIIKKYFLLYNLIFNICIFSAYATMCSIPKYDNLNIEYTPSNNFKNLYYNLTLSDKFFIKIDRYRFTNDIKFGQIHTSNSKIFPKNLYEISYSLDLFRGEKNTGYVDKSDYHISLGIESNSEKPLYTSNENIFITKIKLNFKFEKLPIRIYGLNYSSKKGFWKGWPIPLIYYEYESLSNDLIINIGIPGRFKWEIDDNYTMEFNYYPYKNFNFSIMYCINKKYSLKYEFTTKNKFYLLHNRTNKDEKLFIDTKEIGIKLFRKSPLVIGQAEYGLDLFLFIGYLFDSVYYQSKKINHRNNSNKIDDSLMIKAGVDYKFFYWIP